MIFQDLPVRRENCMHGLMREGRVKPVLYDCVLVATHHDAFDFGMILEYAALVVDTRGVYRSVATNLVKA